MQTLAVHKIRRESEPLPFFFPRNRRTQALQDNEYIYVVLPFCTGGELFSIVSANRGLSEDTARPIFRGLLAGMAFLHDLQICHR